MKTVRAALVVLALFTLACAGNRVKYRLLDSGDPTDAGDSGGEDSGGEDSEGDADTDADAPYTRWDGVERFEYSFSTTPGERDCEMIWNVTGTPSAIECLDCLFAFDVTLAYDAANSPASANCEGLASDLTYSYGYIEDYDGFSVIVVAHDNDDGTFNWSAFGYAGFYASEDTLKYTIGNYIDFAYNGYYTDYVTYYYTRYTWGEAQLTR